jgi:hypothetical protein
MKENRRNTLLSNLLTTIILVVVCTGCTTVNEPRYKVSHGMVYNSSTQEVHDVRVVHEPTKKAVMTNSILPDRSFDIGFQDQRLMADHAVFTWTDDSGKRHKQIVDLPRPLRKNEAMHEVIYTIDQKNNVLVSIKPLD